MLEEEGPRLKPKTEETAVLDQFSFRELSFDRQKMPILNLQVFETFTPPISHMLSHASQARRQSNTFAPLLVIDLAEAFPLSQHATHGPQPNAPLSHLALLNTCHLLSFYPSLITILHTHIATPR